MMKRNESFDSGAAQYDEGRLSYPDDVIDWIIEKTYVSKDERLLEIGAGTGQATIPFAKRGFSIHCIELGKNLADLLIQKTGGYNVTVDISSFEDWESPKLFSTSFIFSATAFHWVDINIKYKKCHSLLSDGGYLVLMWNNDEPSTKNPVIEEAYKRLFYYYPEK
jgi:SAM-dependent methyltransferase